MASAPEKHFRNSNYFLISKLEDRKDYIRKGRWPLPFRMGDCIGLPDRTDKGSRMSSLFLGDFQRKNRKYEVHAFTNGLPFREFAASEVGDRELFSKMLHERYNVLKSGRPIYCTAVRPDSNTETEMNPHDDRNGTIHFVSLNSDGDIVCGLSMAIDVGESDSGDRIGVPLENRWRAGDYPVPNVN